MRSTIKFLLKHKPIQQRLMRGFSRKFSSGARKSNAVPKPQTIIPLTAGFVGAAGTTFLLSRFIRNQHTIEDRHLIKTTAAPLYILKRPRIDFHSVCGYEETIEAFAGILFCLQHPAQFDALKAAMPSGVLLTGESGVGKTMMVEALAGHAGVRLLSVYAKNLLGNNLHETEEKIKILFNEARAATPCVLFIDEIEALMGDASNNPAQGCTIAGYLKTECAGDNKEMLIVAATNQHVKLDDVFTSGGLLEKHIHIKLPDRETRVAMLKTHLDNIIFDDTLSFEILADMTKRYSGRRIDALMGEATMLAVRENAPVMTRKHFERAKIIGSRTPPEINEDRLRTVALHEAGHAIVVHAFNYAINYISVIPNTVTSGLISWTYHGYRKDRIEQDIREDICISLGGVAAESLANKHIEGGASDREKAHRLAMSLITNREPDGTIKSLAYEIILCDVVSQVLDGEWLRAKEIITEYQNEWEQMTDILVEAREMLGAEVVTLMSGEMPTAAEQLEHKRKIREQLPLSKLHEMSRAYNNACAKPTLFAPPQRLISEETSLQESQLRK